MEDPQVNTNIKSKNFLDIPVRSLIFLIKKLKLFDLFELYAKDCRAKQATYPLASLLMVGLEILLFRYKSKNDFYQNRILDRSYKNLGHLAHIKEDLFPHSKTLDDAFWILNPSDLEPILFTIFKSIRSSNLFTNHRSLKKNGSYQLMIDAIKTHTYYPASQHPCEACPYCLKRERENKEGEKKIWYLHNEVVASLIFEGGFQLPLYCYRVKKRKEWDCLSEDDLKQECEMTALPFILQKIRTYLPKIKFTILLDGLYANQPVLDSLKQFHFDFSIVLKRLSSVKQDFKGLPKIEKIRHLASKRFFLTQTACFANQLAYQNHELNVIEFNEYAQKKPTKRFAKIHQKQVHYQWIVSQMIHEATVFNLCESSRSRWRGEDFFNSLKNRGFYAEHDYSRHPNSQGIWFYLTLIAFALTSILQLCDLGILSRKKTTIGSWMRQMAQDLFYLSYECIFLCSYPKQLRFSLWMNAG